MSSQTRPHERLLCVGIDPQPEVLDAWGVADSEAGLAAFLNTIVPLIVESGCRVVKPQVAFFERHGVAGMRHLALLLGELRSHGIITIGDAKRGDIGSTMVGYAEAWLTPGSDFEVDFLTLVPYQGLGALEPALSLAMHSNKGVFVLAATSNPEARATQTALRHDGLSVAQGVVRDLAGWVEQKSASAPHFGVVLGATVNPGDYGLDMASYPGMPILAPGFGHQGATLSDAKILFPGSSPVYAVVARSVLLSGEDGFRAAVAAAQEELHS
jgi:orotidine-5'-phosphate decarboxylase